MRLRDLLRLVTQLRVEAYGQLRRFINLLPYFAAFLFLGLVLLLSRLLLRGFRIVGCFLRLGLGLADRLVLPPGLGLVCRAGLGLLDLVAFGLGVFSSLLGVFNGGLSLFRHRVDGVGGFLRNGRSLLSGGFRVRPAGLGIQSICDLTALSGPFGGTGFTHLSGRSCGPLGLRVRRLRSGLSYPC